VYDMYPWDGAGPGGRAAQPSATPRSREGSAPPHAARATQAVQAALDRRDNGGDAAAAVDAVSKTMAGPPRQ
jgi:hypothetical protein